MSDSRLGFSTHFDQQGSSPWWIPSVVMPLIAASGAAYIRDDWNWNLGEPTMGNYQLYPVKQIWLEAAAEYGLGVVAILDPNTVAGYADPYDPTAAANYCAWLVQQEAANGSPIAVIEVTNEPNNYYQGVEGSTWMTKLVTLTEAVYTAVHAVSDTLVIGYGAQGSQVLNMLSATTPIDGVVYHPYDNGNDIPETCYEPPYTNYVNWVQTVQGATTMPIWETERNCDNLSSSHGEYIGACWNARRLLQSFGLGVQHTFIYDFADSTSQSVLDNNYNKRQAWYVLEKILSALTGLTTTGSGVTLTPGASNFDISDFYSYVFSSVSSTVAAVWLGNHAPSPPSSSPTPGSGTIAFPVANSVTSAARVVDLVHGLVIPLTTYTTSLSGGVLSVFAFPISDCPRLIIAK